MFPSKKKQAEEKPKRELGAFADYPTAYVMLDENHELHPEGVSEPDLIKQRRKYILAKCHYKATVNAEGEEERAYDLEYSHIAELLYMVPDPKNKNYPSMITRIVRYGEEANEPKLANRW